MLLIEFSEDADPTLFEPDAAGDLGIWPPMGLCIPFCEEGDSDLRPGGFIRFYTTISQDMIDELEEMDFIESATSWDDEED